MLFPFRKRICLSSQQKNSRFSVIHNPITNHMRIVEKVILLVPMVTNPVLFTANVWSGNVNWMHRVAMLLTMFTEPKKRLLSGHCFLQKNTKNEQDKYWMKITVAYSEATCWNLKEEFSPGIFYERNSVVYSLTYKINIVLWRLSCS